MERNANLIVSLPRRLVEDIAVNLDKLAVSRPFDRQAVQAMLENSYKVTGSKARLIARDQTSKLTADLNRMRQEDVGVTEYDWATVRDNRVRISHAANEGRRFQWASPPGTGHPGAGIMCRCMSRPVLPPAWK